jgi:hypothetical protein
MLGMSAHGFFVHFAIGILIFYILISEYCVKVVLWVENSFSEVSN